MGKGGERTGNPYELTASVTALANALSCKLNEEKLSLLGDTLATIAVQRGICTNGKQK